MDLSFILSAIDHFWGNILVLNVLTGCFWRNNLVVETIIDCFWRDTLDLEFGCDQEWSVATDISADTTWVVMLLIPPANLLFSWLIIYDMYEQNIKGSH